MVDLEQTTIQEQIKRITAFRGLTLNDLRDEYNRRYEKKYYQQSFSKKLSSGSLKWEELKNIGEILGFDVKLILREENKIKP